MWHITDNQLAHEAGGSAEINLNGRTIKTSLATTDDKHYIVQGTDLLSGVESQALFTKASESDPIDVVWYMVCTAPDAGRHDVYTQVTEQALVRSTGEIQTLGWYRFRINHPSPLKTHDLGNGTVEITLGKDLYLQGCPDHGTPLCFERIVTHTSPPIRSLAFIDDPEAVSGPSRIRRIKTHTYTSLFKIAECQSIQQRTQAVTTVSIRTDNKVPVDDTVLRLLFTNVYGHYTTGKQGHALPSDELLYKPLIRLDESLIDEKTGHIILSTPCPTPPNLDDFSITYAHEDVVGKEVRSVRAPLFYYEGSGDERIVYAQWAATAMHAALFNGLMCAHHYGIGHLAIKIPDGFQLFDVFISVIPGLIRACRELSVGLIVQNLDQEQQQEIMTLIGIQNTSVSIGVESDDYLIHTYIIGAKVTELSAV